MPFLIHSYYFRTIIITVCRYSFSFFLSTFFIIRKRRWRRFPRLFHPLLTSLKTIQFKFNKLEGKRVCFREKAFQERLAIFRRVQLRGQRRTLYNSDIITRVTGDTNIERYGRAACYERRSLRSLSLIINIV